MVPEPIPRLDERYFADLLQIRCKGRADVVRGERSPKHRLWPNAHAGRPSRRGRSASGLFVSPCHTPALVSSMAKNAGSFMRVCASVITTVEALRRGRGYDP